MYKNKIKIIFVSLIISFLGFFCAHAVSKSQKWAILDTFKNKQYNLLFESSLWDLTKEDKSIFNISNKINIFKNIKTSISEEKKELEMKKEIITKRIWSLKEQIKKLDKQIENSTNNIKTTNAKIINTKNEYDSIKNTINIIRKKIIENKKILLQYFDYLYRKTNILHINGEIDNIRSILLNKEDISDILDDIYFKQIAQITWKNLIDKHRKYIKETYIKKIDLEKKEELLKKLRKSLIIQRKIIKDKKEFKEKILKISKWQDILYKRYINNKLRLEKKLKLKSLKEMIRFNSIKQKLLEKHGCEFLDFSKNLKKSKTLSSKCLALNKIIQSESKLWSFNKEWNNIFDWPINPSLGISAYFRDAEYKEEFWADHDWLDIVTKQWTFIQAPADWYIILLEPPTSQDYSYLAIRHANWYITVYGHLNEIFIEKYDFVKKWQVFAKTGWEFWTNWAWFMTTWPHLHMEVWADKKNVDPLSFMSLVDLWFDFLPEKYKFKFYSDFKKNVWYEYKNRDEKSLIFKLEWDTEVERQKSLIKKYAVWTFNNRKMWVEESLDGNIDPSFVMCIWLAETSLGKNLKTPYNIWNVWNTDSWDTIDYLNARSGIYWIVRTLNNKILWHYNELKDLSRYWNKTWPIYASSPDHWHNNIIKCMSHIKWRYIPDNYNFRILR